MPFDRQSDASEDTLAARDAVGNEAALLHLGSKTLLAAGLLTGSHRE
jgi:hypothetical protein